MALMGLAACHRRQHLLHTACSFDSPTNLLPGWANAATPASTDFAHSPPASTWAGAGRTFSGGFMTPLGSLGPHGELPRKVRVRAWVWVASARTPGAAVVAQVRCHGRRPDVWLARSVQEVVNRLGQWEQVEYNYYFPDDLKSDDELVVFLWQLVADADAVYLDDMEIDVWR